MKKLEGGLNNVRGYRYSAVEAGIRYANRPDLALIAADGDCAASGVFTTNKICAAPVRLSRSRINNTVRAIVINATNANACTGDEGYANAEAVTAAAAKELGIDASAVLNASTGIIGVQLPREKMISAVPGLVSALAPGKGDLVARAIMTTDTVPKEAAYRFTCGRGEFTIAGTGKGVGMIAPNMATLLVFLATDAPVAKKDLDAAFSRCIDRSLNAITVDGDMSTNDTAVILSPASGETLRGGDLAAFEETLLAVLGNLAEQLVMDAEGATKLARVAVTGARNETDARKIARAVANSLLVKTALFGMDPNWGRIACAAGYSGADVEEKNLSIHFGDLCLLKKGVPQNPPRESMKQALAGREFTIRIDAGLGSGAFTYLTCDISYDYVKINAEYST
jgi:glutamate N-acetyltransferase/amino-acid N-acetyltransferase